MTKNALWKLKQMHHFIFWLWFSFLNSLWFSLFSHSQFSILNRAISLNSTARPISALGLCIFYIYRSYFAFLHIFLHSILMLMLFSFSFFLGFADGKWYSSSARFCCWQFSKYVILPWLYFGLWNWVWIFFFINCVD